MRSLALLGVLLATGTAAAADTEVENPLYKSWAKHKPGTTMTIRTLTETAGQKIEATSTYKLIEVKADKLVLEVSSKQKVGGMEFDVPAQKMEHEKTFKITGTPPKADPKAEKPDFKTTTGEESLKIKGKDYKTKWTKTISKQGDTDFETQVWTSDELPDSSVKMLTKTKSKDGTTTTVSMEVIDFKTP